MNELPPGTIKYSSKVVTIDTLDHFKLVHLADGSILKTKVVDFTGFELVNHSVHFGYNLVWYRC